MFSQQRRRVTGIYTSGNLQKIMLTQLTPLEKKNPQLNIETLQIEQTVAKIRESAEFFGKSSSRENQTS